MVSDCKNTECEVTVSASESPSAVEHVDLWENCREATAVKVQMKWAMVIFIWFPVVVFMFLIQLTEWWAVAAYPQQGVDEDLAEPCQLPTLSKNPSLQAIYYKQSTEA